VSLNSVARRGRLRRWHLIGGTALLAGAAVALTTAMTSSHGHSGYVPTANSKVTDSPYTSAQLTAALLTHDPSLRGFRVGGIRGMPQLSRRTGCFQLDASIQSHNRHGVESLRVFRRGQAVIAEQLDSESAANMHSDFAANIAALGTCHSLVLHLGDTSIPVRLSPVDDTVNGANSAAYRLGGVYRGAPIVGFMGIATTTDASGVTVLCVYPGDGAAPVQPSAVFQAAVAKARNSLH